MTESKTDLLKPVDAEEALSAGVAAAVRATFERTGDLRQTAQLHHMRFETAKRLLRTGAREERGGVPADVFALNGVWVLRGECRDCQVTLHSELGPVNEGEPTDLLVQLARGVRRTCDECIDRIEAAGEREDARRRLDGLIVASQMPTALQGMAFADMTRDSDRRARAISAAQAWAEGRLDKPGMYVFGAVGAGKTRLAATAAWARLHEGKPIRWCSVVTLFQNLNRAYADKDRRAALQVLLGTDPLVLDDLDKVNPTEFGKSQVFTAINERVQAGVPLFVTANSRPSEIGERYDPAVMSRLLGHCLVFELDGPDRRLELDVG